MLKFKITEKHQIKLKSTINIKRKSSIFIFFIISFKSIIYIHPHAIPPSSLTLFLFFFFGIFVVASNEENHPFHPFVKNENVHIRIRSLIYMFNSNLAISPFFIFGQIDLCCTKAKKKNP